MKKFLILNIFVFMLVSFVLPSRVLATGGTWIPVGSAVSTGDVNSISLAFDNSNIPYVAYSDVNNGNKATVMKFDGTNWVQVGSTVSTGSGYNTSLAFNSNIPYVAYRDNNNGGKVTVMKFDGTNWVPVGSAVSTGQADYISLTFDSNIPYVAYRDYSNGNKATVMKFDGTNWLPVGSAVSAGDVNETPLAFDSNIPYVAYRDDANNGYKATVKKFDGTNWVLVGSAVSAGQAGSISLAFDSNTPYVAYYDANNIYKATVMKFDGTNWLPVGSAVSTGGTYQTSLAFDSNIPYVAYTDNSNGGKVTVMKFDGTNWVPVGSAVSTGSAVYISIAFDSNIPYVVYADANNGYKATVMKLFTDPIITSYSGNFTEPYADDGSVTGSKVITLGNDTFVNASGTLTQNTHYTLSPIPAGLSPVMTVDEAGETAILTFTGNAVSSTPADNVANLTITFLNGAFTNTLASGVVNYSNNQGSINFISHSFQGTQILYGSDGAGNNDNVKLYTIDLETGEVLTTIGLTGHNINGMDFDPTTGLLYGNTAGGDNDGDQTESLFTINTATGLATFLGQIQDADNNSLPFPDIAFRSDGTLYGWSSDDYSLYTIDTACDELDAELNPVCIATRVSETQLNTNGYGGGLAFDSNDNLYLFGEENGGYIEKINPDTGELMSQTEYLNPSEDGRVILAAKFDGSDTLFATRSDWGGQPADLVRINLVGEITSTGDNNPIMPYMTALAFYLLPDPTCTDGIQNQDETGIDEGGVCTPEPEPEPEPIPVVHHTSSGSSVSVRYNNLLTMGNTSAAQALAQQFPNQITIPPTTIAGCDNRTTGFSTITGQSCLGNVGTTISPTLSEEHIIYNFGSTTLKNGSVGEAVKELQRFLNAKLNLGLVVDGNFGPKTKAVVILFQKANGLVPDGLVGKLTKAKMNGM